MQNEEEKMARGFKEKMIVDTREAIEEVEVFLERARNGGDPHETGYYEGVLRAYENVLFYLTVKNA